MGLILEGCVEAALRRTTFNELVSTPKYDPDSMTPDFLIPNAEAPDYFVEVTQTEARNSFQMKTLRYFESVCNAKAHFGKQVTSVNILMGDPAIELPASNVQAMFGFFDANLNPRATGKSKAVQSRLTNLEAEALQLAGDERVKDVMTAVAQVVGTHSKAIDDLAAQLQELLDRSAPKKQLDALWDHEHDRISSLRDIDGRLPDAPTYKRPILQALFFSDKHFKSLLETRNPNRLAKPVVDQLIACDLADTTNTAGRVVIDRDFLRFLGNADDARRLRKYCADVIEVDRSMRFFFEDIRDANRRSKMVGAFLGFIRAGQAQFESALYGCMTQDSFAGVEHRRCWVADLAPLYVGESHNSFNRRMFQHPNYNLSLGNPYNNITIRSPRLGRDPGELRQYASVAADCIFQACQDFAPSGGEPGADELEGALLRFRISASMKLQKLNPLHLVVQAEADGLHASAHYGAVENVISDFASDSAATGRFRLFLVSRKGHEVLVNAVYADAQGDIHKAKEWASRGRSFLYRYDDEVGITRRSASLVFVADGPWSQEAIKKLRTAGWIVIRLEKLGETLSILLREPND